MEIQQKKVPETSSKITQKNSADRNDLEKCEVNKCVRPPVDRNLLGGKETHWSLSVYLPFFTCLISRDGGERLVRQCYRVGRRRQSNGPSVFSLLGRQQPVFCRKKKWWGASGNLYFSKRLCEVHKCALLNKCAIERNC